MLRDILEFQKERLSEWLQRQKQYWKAEKLRWQQNWKKELKSCGCTSRL